MSKPAEIIDGEIEAPKARAVAKRKLEVVPAEPAHADDNPMLAMIKEIMNNPSLPMERVNQAFDFYKRLDDDKSLKAFNAAFADAKAEFTPIVKKHLVEYGEGAKKTSYKHEDLGDIAKIVDPILGKYGLSYRYRGTSNPNEPISVTCIVSHRLGYSEETTLHAGADGSGGKNSIQAIGSAVTYLQRYTLRLALGLATGRDDDGKAASIPETSAVTDKQVEKLQSDIKETNADITKFLRYFKIESLSDMPAKRYAEAIGLLDERRQK